MKVLLVLFIPLVIVGYLIIATLRLVLILIFVPLMSIGYLVIAMRECCKEEDKLQERLRGENDD